MKSRSIAGLLIAAMLLSLLVGCAPATEPNTNTSSVTPPAETEGDTDPQTPQSIVLGTIAKEPAPIPEGYLELASDGESRYQIVYAASLPLRVREYAIELSEAIGQATGASVEVLSDSQAEPSEYEIRLGHTTHVATDEERFAACRAQDLKESGYAAWIDGKTVYLYADGEVGIYSGIKYLTQKATHANTERRYFGIREQLDAVYTEGRATTATYLGADAQYVYFTVNDGTLDECFVRISFTGNKAWRLQTKEKESDSFNDIGASQRLALSLQEAPALTAEPITVSEQDGGVIATASDGSRAELTFHDFSLKFYTPAGALSQHISNLADDGSRSLFTGDLLPNEGVFGTGERFNTVNQRGRRIHMFIKDIWSRADACYLAIPLLTFTRGAGVFLNIYEEMYLTLGQGDATQADTWTADVQGTDIDCYIYTSEDMSDAIYGYSKLSGFAEKPEEWTYGMLICRYSPDMAEKWSFNVGAGMGKPSGYHLGVYDVIAMMETYDLPWTGIIAEAMDLNDQSNHDEYKELCDYVHSLGKKFLAYIPIGCMGGVADYYKNDFLISMTTDSGMTTTMLPGAHSNNPDGGGSGTYKYLDITNPEAVEWFFGKYWDYLTTEIGVDGCKIDFCELLPEYNQLNYYDKEQPTGGSHHWYPTAFCAMFFDMLAQKPDSGMNFTRGGGIGAQRSPYMWAGDQIRTYECVKYQLIACLSSGISGLPFMSYDMSGYKYGSGNGNGTGYHDRPYVEAQVFVRGLQFTAFSVNMQQHGTVRHAFDFADGYIRREYINGASQKVVLKDADGNTLYVTDENGEKILMTDVFGEVVTDRNGNLQYLPQYDYLIRPGEMAYITDIYRGYVKLHEYLAPYIDEYATLACTTGMPLMRPLVLMWQNDPNVYNIDDEYMFGDAFLLAPILNDRYYRDIYLPRGEWLDLNTGKTYSVGSEGMRLTSYRAELEQLPTFYNLNTTSKTAAELLPGIKEIYSYIDSIDCTPFYDNTGRHP